MNYSDIKDFNERCETHPAHQSGMVTEKMLKHRLHEEIDELRAYIEENSCDPKERLIRIMGTFDLATGHADTWDELLDSLESELRDVLGYYREASKQHLTQEPVAILERDPSIGLLRVTYEDCITELEAGTYPLYVQPQGWRDNVAQAYLKGYDEGRPEWVSITREEVLDLTDTETHPLEFARAIESKLKEKNNG